MKRFSFTSVTYSTNSFNIAMLFLRISFGVILMLRHGFDKVRNFDNLQHTFYSFIGMGPKASLILALFAEIFCSLLVVMGLFTRWACIPLLFTFLVVIFGHDAGKDLMDSELAIAYFTAFLVLLFCGPGQISVDGMINKK
ncbi:MAG: DoxX family protein [Bacteroidota bacterium]|nr:DoxX family protein [Bacteroidota bacterium]